MKELVKRWRLAAVGASTHMASHFTRFRRLKEIKLLLLMDHLMKFYKIYNINKIC